MEHDEDDECKACALGNKIAALCDGEDVDIVIPAVMAMLCSIIRNYDTERAAGFAVKCIREAVEEAGEDARHLNS